MIGGRAIVSYWRPFFFDFFLFMEPLKHKENVSKSQVQLMCVRCKSFSKYKELEGSIHIFLREFLNKMYILNIWMKLRQGEPLLLYNC